MIKDIVGENSVAKLPPNIAKYEDPVLRLKLVEISGLKDLMSVAAEQAAPRLFRAKAMPPFAPDTIGYVQRALVRYFAQYLLRQNLPFLPEKTKKDTHRQNFIGSALLPVYVGARCLSEQRKTVLQTHCSKLFYSTAKERKKIKVAKMMQKVVQKIFFLQNPQIPSDAVATSDAIKELLGGNQNGENLAVEAQLLDYHHPAKVWEQLSSYPLEVRLLHFAAYRDRILMLIPGYINEISTHKS